MNWLRKFGVGYRLPASFIAVIVLGVSGYAYVVVVTRQAAARHASMDVTMEESVDTAHQASHAAQEIALSTVEYVYTGNPRYKAAEDHADAAAETCYQSLRSSLSALPHNQSLLASLDTLIRQDEQVCDPLGSEAIRLAGSGRREEAIALVEGRYAVARAELETENLKLEEQFDRYRGSEVSDMQRRVSLAVTIGWVVQGLALAISLVIAAIICRSIAANLRRLLQAQNELQRSEKRFQSLIRHASDVVAVFSPAGELQYLSPASRRHFGYDAADYDGRTFFDFVHPDDQMRARALFTEAAAQPAGNIASELRLSHQDGEWRPAEIQVQNLIADVSVGGIVIAYRDITERKAFEQELAHQAFHDPLTALPNRALFLNRLENALARALRRKDTVGVMFIDIDNFKLINDSLSRQAGDELLKAVSERLQSCLRTGDTVARIGDDEFSILLENIGSADDASLFAGRITSHLRQPITIHGHDLFVTSSIGVAISTHVEVSAEDLLRDADIAMVHAKNSGKDTHALFEHSMNAQATERLEMEAMLRRAVASDQMRVYYQPIIDLETKQIRKFEALVRWQHPTLGLVPPLKFIPLAEETGVIGPLGDWVMREACRQCRAWQIASPEQEELSIAVNLSARQLQLPGLAHQVAQILSETGLSANHLELEITESVMMGDPDAAIRTLQELKSLGVHIAVDDFGTGYSSMQYLSRFPIDTLKIDRYFIQKMVEPEGFAIVHAIVDLSKSLHLRVVSEGIETEEQLSMLQLLDCNFGQGYLISAPVPAANAESLLAFPSSGAVAA
ncbi:hypothetical protein CCAX7_009570 [Capsulimonas corticalis]|uniref:Uncharacterized protein n=1 Tax=Capsulimonas corticalis TaxID=2219043 RepID=A0A402CU94_9BACT|nr:EAL domain-containing protein [Capsulimonas corticalis]BDI28906.1 hypothetical protein CCAX7_009570 [Capsulimonas corticalis]